MPVTFLVYCFPGTTSSQKTTFSPDFSSCAKICPIFKAFAVQHRFLLFPFFWLILPLKNSYSLSETRPKVKEIHGKFF